MTIAESSALNILEKTSRTFYIPITSLPEGLQEAVTSGYLCLRAIDEVEDHPDLETHQKATILKSISLILQAQTTIEEFAHDSFYQLFDRIGLELPEVTLRISE